MLNKLTKSFRTLIDLIVCPYWFWIGLVKNIFILRTRILDTNKKNRCLAEKWYTIAWYIKIEKSTSLTVNDYKYFKFFCVFGAVNLFEIILWLPKIYIVHLRVVYYHPSFTYFILVFRLKYKHRLLFCIHLLYLFLHGNKLQLI